MELKDLRIDIENGGQLYIDGHQIEFKKDKYNNPIIDEVKRNEDGTLNVKFQMLIKFDDVYKLGWLVIPRFTGKITVYSDGYQINENPKAYMMSEEKVLYTIRFGCDE